MFNFLRNYQIIFYSECLPPPPPPFFFKVYLFLSVLDLHCCMQAFFSAEIGCYSWV